MTCRVGPRALRRRSATGVRQNSTACTTVVQTSLSPPDTSASSSSTLWHKHTRVNAWFRLPKAVASRCVRLRAVLTRTRARRRHPPHAWRRKPNRTCHALTHAHSARTHHRRRHRHWIPHAPHGELTARSRCRPRTRRAPDGGVGYFRFSSGGKLANCKIRPPKVRTTRTVSRMRHCVERPPPRHSIERDVPQRTNASTHECHRSARVTCTP